MSNSVLKDKDNKILNPKIPRYEKRLRKVLWTNSNPSQEMGADVVINLSSSDYDELEWLFAYSTTAGNNFSVSCLKGKNIMAVTVGYNDATLIRRIFDYVNDTQYKSRVAKWGTVDSNTHIIPIEIIGIKNS